MSHKTNEAEINQLEAQFKILRQEYMAIENQASKKRQELLAVETRLAELACPFVVGQVVEVPPGYKGGRYRIEAIKPTWRGWAMEARRFLKGGGLGKQVVELNEWNKPKVVEE